MGVRGAHDDREVFRGWRFRPGRNYLGCVRDELGDDPGEFRALVLLEKVAGADDGGVCLTGCTRDLGSEDKRSPPLVMASESLERAQEGTLEAA